MVMNPGSSPFWIIFGSSIDTFRRKDDRFKTHYLGLELKTVGGSGFGLSKKVSTVKKMEDAGISAVVLYSLFEEQITHDSLAFNYFMEHGTERFAESLSYFPNLDRYNVSPDEYLEKIRQNKEAVDIPIIASLNGVSNSGWVEYAQKMVQAGADALELNTYYLPTNSDMKSVELEDNLIELVKAVCTHVQIPVSVKLSPYYTALPNLACRLADAGAQGLVLFNRFIQPDIDIEEMEVDPTLNLSTSAELLLPLRWTAILFGQVKADLALTSGVHTGVDLIKAVMAGANVAMVASEFVANGVGRATEMLAEMSTWMSAYDHPSVERMRQHEPETC